MEIIILPTKEDAAHLFAPMIARELRAKPHMVLGLATGKTMKRVYDVKLHQTDGLDFSLCRTFNLDEYVGLTGLRILVCLKKDDLAENQKK